MQLYIYIYIYIYKYYEGKKGRNYVSRQACFVNRFTLQGFNVLGLGLYIYIYIYIYIVGGKRQINYQLVPIDLFRGCPLIRGFN